MFTCVYKCRQQKAYLMVNSQSKKNRRFQARNDLNNTGNWLHFSSAGFLVSFPHLMNVSIFQPKAICRL